MEVAVEAAFRNIELWKLLLQEPERVVILRGGNFVTRMIPTVEAFRKYEAAQRPEFYAIAPNRTETSFETPGSCMVTP